MVEYPPPVPRHWCCQDCCSRLSPLSESYSYHHTRSREDTKREHPRWRALDRHHWSRCPRMRRRRSYRPPWRPARRFPFAARRYCPKWLRHSPTRSNTRHIYRPSRPGRPARCHWPSRRGWWRAGRSRQNTRRRPPGCRAQPQNPDPRVAEVLVGVIFCPIDRYVGDPRRRLADRLEKRVHVRLDPAAVKFDNRDYPAAGEVGRPVVHVTQIGNRPWPPARGGTRLASGARFS